MALESLGTPANGLALTAFYLITSECDKVYSAIVLSSELLMPDVDEPGTNVPSSDKIVSSSNENVLSIYLLLNLKQDCSFDSTSESRQLLLFCILNNWKGLWQCEICSSLGVLISAQKIENPSLPLAVFSWPIAWLLFLSRDSCFSYEKVISLWFYC